ncbi:phage tail protein [Fusibacter sp. JL216-2]|uniref:phage tail protein n=1 Tax=Fusibacter sp. JL216-2 TaxID=3071453 RepID=UPI003D32EE99
MEPILGQIQLFPFGFAPEGWEGCVGQILPIRDNEALYAVLGLTYGGDGRNTFGLPDLRNAIPIDGMWYCISMEGMFPRRS